MLEPEQEKQILKELADLESAVTKAIDDYIDMRTMGMEYVQIVGVIQAAINDGSNFDHLRAVRDSLESDGCTHISEQLARLGVVFFMLGREVERQSLAITPTFLGA